MLPKNSITRTTSGELLYTDNEGNPHSPDTDIGKSLKESFDMSMEYKYWLAKTDPDQNIDRKFDLVFPGYVGMIGLEMKKKMIKDVIEAGDKKYAID